MNNVNKELRVSSRMPLNEQKTTTPSKKVLPEPDKKTDPNQNKESDVI